MVVSHNSEISHDDERVVHPFEEDHGAVRHLGKRNPSVARTSARVVRDRRARALQDPRYVWRIVCGARALLPCQWTIVVVVIGQYMFARRNDEFIPWDRRCRLAAVQRMHYCEKIIRMALQTELQCMYSGTETARLPCPKPPPADHHHHPHASVVVVFLASPP